MTCSLLQIMEHGAPSVTFSHHLCHFTVSAVFQNGLLEPRAEATLVSACRPRGAQGQMSSTRQTRRCIT